MGSGTEKRTPGDILAAENYPVRLCSFSALDSYTGLPPLPFTFAETSADIAALAKIFENLRFPGVDIADAAVEDAEGKSWYFRCSDPDDKPSAGVYSFFSILSLTQDLKSRRFMDAFGIYPQIRALRDGGENTLEFPRPEETRAGADRFAVLMESAVVLARYENLKAPPRGFDGSSFPVRGALPGPEAQRILLSALMVSPRPDRGLEFLMRAGLLETIWPELAAMNNVDHSKEFHPEGNVWKHTLETFRHRKPGFAAPFPGAYDLRLSLGLLLHDTGKPLAVSYGGRRFDGHAELGARAGRRFLERLGFEASLIDDVYFLVRNHMLPAAIRRLPLTKTSPALESPLFPILLELYRCDESSSFKSPEGYYESSAAYRTYLRNTRNPYRTPDGKITGKGTGRSKIMY